MVGGDGALLTVALDFARSEAERVAAVARIADVGDRDVVVIPLAALFAETQGRLRSALGEALDRLSAIELLCRELRASDPARRLRAAQLLGPLGAPTALPALIDALRDPAPKVRELAASALIPLKDVRALPQLETVLLGDNDPDVRGAAAQALGELDDMAALEPLERAAGCERDEFTIILIERSIYRLSERAAA